METLEQASAHFFCRRCGVHVVHAPDFPHAAVANVNVHCIHPESITSLAVGFVSGGGVELPGVGEPVEGMCEVCVVLDAFARGRLSETTVRVRVG